MWRIHHKFAFFLSQTNPNSNWGMRRDSNRRGEEALKMKARDVCVFDKWLKCDEPKYTPEIELGNFPGCFGQSLNCIQFWVLAFRIKCNQKEVGCSKFSLPQSNIGPFLSKTSGSGILCNSENIRKRLNFDLCAHTGIGQNHRWQNVVRTTIQQWNSFRGEIAVKPSPIWFTSPLNPIEWEIVNRIGLSPTATPTVPRGSSFHIYTNYVQFPTFNRTYSLNESSSDYEHKLIDAINCCWWWCYFRETAFYCLNMCPINCCMCALFILSLYLSPSHLKTSCNRIWCINKQFIDWATVRDFNVISMKKINEMR